MYKVFLNANLICFSSHSNFDKSFKHISQEIDAEFIQKLLQMLNNDNAEKFVVIADDIDSVFKKFESYFQIIEAAGGLVFNDNDELLMILRNGKWDLPKGKIELGESIEEAALREVEEECGINKLNLIEKLGTSYHIYQFNQKWILKKTYWFKMYSEFKENLIPQTEEGIEKVIWANNSFIEKTAKKNTYQNILLLLNDL